MSVKCGLCNNRIGKRKCNIVNNFICSQCCGENRNWNLCNTECSFFPAEKVERNLLPKGLELTEVVRGITQRFDEPLFLPNIYDLITCNVTRLDIGIINFNRVNIDMEFNLSATREVERELYLKDGWKVQEGFISNEQGDVLVPLVMVCSNITGTSKLINNKYYYNDCDIEEIKTSYNYSIWLPYSYPRTEIINVKGMPEFPRMNEVKGTCLNGKHFFKKNDVYWGKLSTKHNYKFSIEIEYSSLAILDDGKLILPYGYLLPYRRVNVEKYSFSTLKGVAVCEESFMALLIPSEDKIPKLFATPLSTNERSIEYKGFCKHFLNSLESMYHYDEFSINDYFCFLKPKDYISISTKYETNNIVTAYFNNIKEVYEEEYSPLKIIIANSGNDIEKINISYSIENISTKNIENIFIKPKEVLEIPLFPTINESSISSINEQFTANLNVEVKCDNNTIFEESTPFNILPRETFIFDFEDDGKKGKIYFYSMLARWVTPNISEIEDIINEVACELDYVIGFSDDKEQNCREIEAIYSVISNHVKYISRTFSLFKGTTALHQKVYLPQNTIKNKGGNCIDLTILLASCLEKLNYRPIVILIPGHAFLGIELCGEIIFIESTFLGYHSFKESTEYAKNNFYKFFDDEFNAKLENRNFSYIAIKVEDARKIKIYPMA